MRKTLIVALALVFGVLYLVLRVVIDQVWETLKPMIYILPFNALAE